MNLTHTIQSTNRDLRTNLLRLHEIPPPKGTALEIIRIAGDDQVELGEVVALVEQSPELALRLLRCANSAYYGQRREISSIRDAIIRVLGLSTTRSLALALALAQSLNFRMICSAFLEQFWLRAVLTAQMARGYSCALGIKPGFAPDTAYLAGLLHEVGFLAMAHCMPGEMNRLFSSKNKLPQEETLTEAFGISPREAGATLCQTWGLPQVICNALAHSTNVAYRGEDWVLAQLVLHASMDVQKVMAGDKNVCIQNWPKELPVSPAAVEITLNRIFGEFEGLKSMALQLSGGG